MLLIINVNNDIFLWNAFTFLIPCIAQTLQHDLFIIGLNLQAENWG